MKRTRDYNSGSSVSYRQRQEKDMETYEKMKDELEAYNEKGVILRLSGRRASSAKIANACCIKECGSYMGDYVLDETGELVEICFERVRQY